MYLQDYGLETLDKDGCNYPYFERYLQVGEMKSL